MFDQYVDAYADLAQAYEATGEDDYAAYVRAYPDLEEFWQKNIKPNGISRKEWGSSHWSESGSKESRSMPKKYAQTKEEWGKRHWESNGQNEFRFVPGYEPYISINSSTGQPEVYYPTDANNRVLVGSPYRAKFDQVPSVITNASTYSSMVSQLYNTVPDVFKTSFLTKGLPSAGIYYYNTKLKDSAWDAKTLGSQPPVGGFDSNYYAQQNPDATKQWENAQSSVRFGDRSLPDLDITGRYSYETFLHQHYTNVGRHQGYRGNAPSEAVSTTRYEEKLDAEKQIYRDQVLGITTDPSGKKQIVIARPEYDEEGNLINTGDVNTILEQEFSRVVGAKDLQKEKQLGSLAQDLLKVSISELKKAKQEESNLSLMKNLPGYGEIMKINSTLTNSILGDSGVGGILNLTGRGNEYKENIEKNIEKITGVSSNSTIYNWQKWFDETLMKRYKDYEIESKNYGEKELQTLQNTAKEEIEFYKKNPSTQKPIYLEISEKYKEQEGGKTLDPNNPEDFKKIMFYIDMESKKAFMDSFIQDYIKPRFDQSKSMDEFISYLDVKENEQNIFQSQTTINKLQQIAELRSRSFLDLIQLAENTTKRFDAKFYLDPIANNTKQLSEKKLKKYELQKQIVAQDFENAKQGITGEDGINWAIEAYRYGYEGNYKTNAETFAKLHNQVKGSTGAVKDENGEAFLFDAAEDILPYEELQQKIKNFGVEMAARKEFYGGAGFMKFVTPEEFADAILSSVSPEENQEEWNKVLKSIGLEGADATVEQVKEYLIDQLRTEEAKNIRESIKYLNEKEEDLNQETLGVSYIERKEDVKKVEGERTVLYDVFKNAGYGGSEDEFYNDFFPDIDRTEQEVISKTTSGKGLEFAFGDMEDPFQAFTSVSSLFGEEETAGSAAFLKDQEEKDQAITAKSSYFKLFEDEEDEVPQKSEAATSFLKDFTSMFKGFN